MKTLIWFKKDLRIQDHAPLAEAAQAEQAAAVYMLEPEGLRSAECDPQHVAFALACLKSLREQLAQRGLPLSVVTGEAVTILQSLHARWGFTHLFSHEETGSGWTYARDKAVAAWCRAQGVQWREWPQTGVVRRLKDRTGWANRWQQRMDASIAQTPARWPGMETPREPPLPSLVSLGLAASRPLPAAGEAAAHDVLNAFVSDRARGYRKSLSSPLTAADGCSRLSAHLAFGTISMRQVHQTTAAAIRRSPDAHLAQDLRGFAGRLRWHCHFMQKLEDEPEIEWRNFARVCDGLREAEFDPALFDAWKAGMTGFPMVDACMRQLRATGWLNFRMRAMLVSFAAYHLWLHWREPGLFLARQFLDFEPGIHWSQMQMQSGTTGINTLRMYSPSKQARDHDPTGAYVRRWVPEFGTSAYPAPVIDERAALARAKERMYGLRRTEQAREEADAIQQRHGSRKSGLPPSSVRPSRQASARTKSTSLSAQRDLFD